MTDSTLEPARGKRSALLLAEVLRQQGLRWVIASPGSRNAPLLLAFADGTDMHLKMAVDERSAAFMALGLAKTLQQPVALICTSGTALLNYAPAVAEAMYSHVPLIVISADRPVEWIDQDDSQTIHQAGVLAPHTLRDFDIPEDNGTDTFLWYVNRVANDAWITATGRPAGPVHINMQFDNPLTETLADTAFLQKARKAEMVADSGELPRKELDRLVEIARDKRIMLVAGFLPPDHKLNLAVKRLAALPQVTVLSEICSNLRISDTRTSIDSMLKMDQCQEPALEPDLVITIGGALVSRQVKAYLRKIRPAECWTLGYQLVTVDCFQSLTRRIGAKPTGVLNHLAAKLHRCGLKDSDYRSLWEAKRQEADEMLHRRLSKAAGEGWNELTALNLLFNRIPAKWNLHLSNGTAIRYADLLMRRLPHACFCNRGVSGIDGSTSTAVGSAIPYPEPTLLVTGDMSFAYDINGLGSLCIPSDFKIAVINNQGGGIFRFIPTTSSLPSQLREPLFCCNPGYDVEALAKAFKFEYFRADNKSNYTSALNRFFNCPDRALLEIVCDPWESAETLHNLFSGK